MLLNTWQASISSGFQGALSIQTLVGILLIVFPGILYLAQIISSINFSLAQKMGLQEKSEEADSILTTAELYAAYWDLFTLGWMPIAGFLILIDHSFWPYISIIAAAIYFDAGGREAAKFLAFKKEKIRIGPVTQQKWFFATYIVMAITALPLLYFSLVEIL